MKADSSWDYFATSIDNIEALTGLNFFNKLPEALQETLEKQTDATDWLPDSNATATEPLAQEALPRNHFNTIFPNNGWGTMIPYLSAVLWRAPL